MRNLYIYNACIYILFYYANTLKSKTLAVSTPENQNGFYDPDYFNAHDFPWKVMVWTVIINSN